MRNRDQFPALDGLRAVGALAVVLTHVAFQTGQYPKGVTGAVLGRLDVGVALFFVLSGFLMSLGFLRPMSEGRSHQPYRAYVIKRFLRIWPVFAVTVVLATSLIARDTSTGSWVHSLTLTHLYSRHFFSDGLTQMWSLETEAAFYALLPFLMAGFALVVRRRGWSARWMYGVLAVLAVLNWVWLAQLAPVIESDRPFVYQWLPAYLCWFAAGIALAVLWVDATRPESHVGVPAAVSRVAASPGALWAIAGSILLIASTPLAGPLNLTAATQSAAVMKSILYTAVAVLVILPAVLGPSDDRYHRILGQPVVRYLGHISYAVFCIHLLVLWYVMDVLDNDIFTGSFLAVAALTIVGSTIAAMALHHLVERPAMRLSARLVVASKAPATAAKSATSATS